MEILSFAQLDQSRHQDLYDFILTMRRDPHYFSDLSSMVCNYSAPVFANGTQFYICTEGERICGTLGMITKEVEIKEEVFITAINIHPDYFDVLKDLLEHAEKQIAQLAYQRIKVGIPPEQSHLIPVAEQAGFGLAYTGHCLKLSDCVALMSLPVPEELQFQELTQDNFADLMLVSNGAFHTSPNGATITPDQMDEIMEKVQKHPGFEQIGYYQGKPAISISLEKVGEEGWIEGLGVHPKFQGRGLAKFGLRQAIETLREAGLREIYLAVIDSNQRAYQLYCKYGFYLDRMTNFWLEKVRHA